MIRKKKQMQFRLCRSIAEEVDYVGKIIADSWRFESLEAVANL